MAWVSRLAAGREIDARRLRVAGARGIDGGAQDIGAHDHAGAAAGRRIVHGAMPADAELADADGVERPQPLAQRLARQRRRQRPGKQLGKQRQHGCPPGRRIVAECFAKSAPSRAVSRKTVRLPLRRRRSRCVPAPCRSFLAAAYSGEVA